MTTSTPIELLRLSPRVYNSLVHEGIDTVEQLRALDVSLIRGIGVKGAEQIRIALNFLSQPRQ